MLRLLKSLWILMPVVMVALLPQVAAAYGTFNLSSQWSDAVNPNGRWSYSEGSVPMAHRGNTEWGLPAWFSPNLSVPIWFKCTSNPNGLDIQTGDVGMHAGYGASTNVTWTVDSTGLATISGGVWMIRDNGRANDWALYRNASLLTQGQISSGDPYSRGIPFLFANGSGGAGAVTNFAVTTGDTIKLSFSRPGDVTPDYAGMNLQIVTSPVPVPPSAVLLGTGLLGLWAWRRRNRQT